MSDPEIKSPAWSNPLKARLSAANKSPYRYRTLAMIAIIDRLDKIIEILERENAV